MTKTKPPKKFDVCFIDCDLIKYRACFSVEKVRYHLYREDEFIQTFFSAKQADEHVKGLTEVLDMDTDAYHRVPEKKIGTLDQAIKACDLIIERIMGKVDAKEYKLYLTGDDSYRPSIATIHKYKGDRPPKPKHLEEVTQHIINNHGAIVVDYVEADDTLTVGLFNCYRKGTLGVVANIDKDIKQAPGWHYDWDKDKFEYITEQEGLLHTYAQAIAGDHVDNYKGIPLIGMKKAYKILDGCESERDMYEAAIEAYRTYFGIEHCYRSWDGKDMVKTPEELFLENMNLAYMLRRKDVFYKIPDKE